MAERLGHGGVLQWRTCQGPHLLGAAAIKRCPRDERGWVHTSQLMAVARFTGVKLAPHNTNRVLKGARARRRGLLAAQWARQR